MTENKTRSIPRAKDLDQFQNVVRGVIGQKCWRADFSYGGELLLHLGARIRCDHPKLAGQLEGEWVFSTCGTPWTLSTPDEQIASVDYGEDFLAKKAKRLENSRITEIKAADEVLAISFSNRCQLRVIPTADDAEADLPYWELFMPNKMMVEFRPGGIWSYKRSDLPVS